MYLKSKGESPKKYFPLSVGYISAMLELESCAHQHPGKNLGGMSTSRVKLSCRRKGKTGIDLNPMATGTTLILTGSSLMSSTTQTPPIYRL